jgi:hypothetical protein
MTGRVIATIVVVVLIVGVIAAGYVTSRRRSKDVQPGEPDRVTGDVVTKLMAELRKSQAETEYWKREAERLQREVDHR